ncbi:MAG TPA: hypothetical protein VK821_06110 [Dehalococcoidia bacterium]|nr:hypothetical protein [Dehalococcoidia bacterium]
MQSVTYDWLGHEWMALRAEGLPKLDVEAQARELFSRLNAELGRSGLSLADTMRTRLWARDRDRRDSGSRVRAATLTGTARSASSSFIAAGYLDSDAAVGVELWAMRASGEGPKTLVEYEPPIVPLRYLVRESIVVLSGVTSVLPTLAEQTAEILTAIQGTLAHAGAGGSNAVKISCILHRSQSSAELRPMLAPVLEQTGATVDFGVAEGYSTSGKLVEIEVTAALGGQ